jgi:hypothetical protein
VIATDAPEEWDVDATPTYYQSADGITISRERALKEIRDHGCKPADFFAEVGDKAEYSAQGVLDWLGY